MDQLPLKTYHLVVNQNLTIANMKSQRILLSTLVVLSFLPASVSATTRHHPSSAANSQNGVYLQTPNPQTALEHNNRGVELGSKGLWPDAIKEHEKALAMEPGNKDFRTNLSSAQLHYGIVLFHSGKYYEAMKQFRGALFVDPDNLPADESLDECFKKLGKDPLDLKYRRALADDFDTKGLYEDAIVEYRKCLKMDDSGKSHADLGYVLFKADKPVDGFSELKVAVQKHWNADEYVEQSQAHRMLAETELKYAFIARDHGNGTTGMRRLTNAVTEYKRAVTINPADSTAIQGFIDSVRECVALRPTFDNYLMLGGAYLLAHDFQHAKMCYEQCYRIDPRRTELQNARVAYHVAVAKWPTSSDELIMDSLTKVQKFLETDPENPRWLYVLGRLKQRVHDNDGAMEAYRRAEKINPLIDPDLETEIKVLGGVPQTPYLQQNQIATAATGSSAMGAPQAAANGGSAPPGAPRGAGTSRAPAAPSVYPADDALYRHVEQIATTHPNDALDELKKHLDNFPLDGKAYLLKGELEQKTGDFEDAAVDFRMADGLKQPEAKEFLEQVNTIRVQDNIKQADDLTKQGNVTDAVQQLQDAIIKAPDLAFLHSKLAPLLRQMHDDKGAEREEKKAKELEQAK